MIDSSTNDQQDRMVGITQIYRTLEGKLNRPLRVLDLGGGQEFFSLNLAKLGADVHGVDSQDQAIEKIVTALAPGQYDLALGLGVFDRLARDIGVPLVKKMIFNLANATAAGLFEIDPASSQDPRQLLDDYAFVHELAPKLPDSAGRRFYVASNRYWFLNGQTGAFDSWQADQHSLADGSTCKTRRYCFGEGLFVKQLALDIADRRDFNLRGYMNEVAFLSKAPAHFKAPKLLEHGMHEHEAWLVREKLPGELLSDLMQSGKSYDAALVLQDVLDQLAALEAAGLYHEDLRVWNILIGPDGHAALIDYAAISSKADDHGWPYNIFLSFTIFLREVVSGKVLSYDPIRQTSFNPESFPEAYRPFLWNLFASDPGKWNFAFLRDSFLRLRQEGTRFSVATHPGFAAALKAMDEACDIHRNAANFWHHHSQMTMAALKQLQAKDVRK